VRHPTRVREETTLWSSSPRPTGDSPFFAIGTSQGLHTLEGVGYRWQLEKKQFPPDVISGKPASFRYRESSHSDVMAVEWLTSDVIVSGLSDSSIFFHDIRSGGTVTRLQHSHAVSKIRKVDPYRLVVAGYKSVRLFPFLLAFFSGTILSLIGLLFLFLQMRSLIDNTASDV